MSRSKQFRHRILLTVNSSLAFTGPKRNWIVDDARLLARSPRPSFVQLNTQLGESLPSFNKTSIDSFRWHSALAFWVVSDGGRVSRCLTCGGLKFQLTVAHAQAVLFGPCEGSGPQAGIAGAGRINMSDQ